ncbi:MAG: alkylation response protein AidB-like acyl-CoA dehydrogenase [Pirellulaceae bacterium]|jgi:alkylation response protein AidB-like acyl-CoA dehydrogenase
MPEIRTPQDPAMSELCNQLLELGNDLAGTGQWPAQQLQLCADHGVYRWFLPEEQGGFAWNTREIVEGYLHIGAACLTTTFIITQYMGACRRIAACENEDLKNRLLADLVCGRKFATLGISHLTTSHRHLQKPVLRCIERGSELVLDGFSPWVTGGIHADYVVTAATLEDDRQVIIALPTELSGVSCPPAIPLIGLNGSQTGRMDCQDVVVSSEWILDGPEMNVLQKGIGGKTGGLQTSTLALALALAAVEFIENEATFRCELESAAAGLRGQLDALKNDLFSDAVGTPNCSTEELRARANSLVLRATQAALTAAKGRGYVAGHPAGRWCQEALFFLVWSCPQQVLEANLCEFAGLTD